MDERLQLHMPVAAHDLEQVLADLPGKPVTLGGAGGPVVGHVVAAAADSTGIQLDVVLDEATRSGELFRANLAWPG